MVQKMEKAALAGAADSENFLDKNSGRNTSAALATQARRRGGRRSRDKGSRAERAIVKYLQDQVGLAAEKIPLSGSCGGRFVGDITVPVIGRDLVAEVKVRARGFSQLYDWLDGRDLLVIRADRKEPLVIVPLRLAAEIAVAAERGKVR